MESLSNVNIKSRIRQLVVLIAVIVLGVLVSYLISTRCDLQEEKGSTMQGAVDKFAK